MTSVKRIQTWVGLALILAAVLLTAIFAVSPRVTTEANMRFATDTAEETDPDMAELLMLLNGE